MRLLMIRHGETAGNLKHRYVGRTDEPLTEEGRIRLMAARETALREKNTFFRITQEIDTVWVSPMARAKETAAVLFPGKKMRPVYGLRECDFGRFEYKNYGELNKDPFYQRFLDSGGTEGFPEGEGIAAFKKRCADSFSETALWARASQQPVLALVSHGGVIMAIMERFASPKCGYYDWQLKNGEGILAELSFGQAAALAAEPADAACQIPPVITGAGRLRIGSPA